MIESRITHLLSFINYSPLVRYGFVGLQGRKHQPNNVMAATRKVVIIGAGFAGLKLARHIRHVKELDITILDQFNFHQFQPLFYQVATARLEPSSISFPLRKVFQRSENVHVRIGKVSEVDLAAKEVRTSDCVFPYDMLVIATGCVTNFFGNKNIENFGLAMKSVPEALTLRNRILMNFEDALSCREEDKAGVMNIVVAGGGPTGVELAGALIEMKKYVLPKDYPDMDFSTLSVYLVEGSPHTLNNMSDKSKKQSRQYLEDMGVQVWTDALISDYDGKKVMLKDGRTIPTHTLIWTAGVTGNVPPGIPDTLLVRGNRIRVNEFNMVPGYEGLYAIGDIAYMETPAWPKGHPQLANVANHQADHLAKNMKRMFEGKAMQPFTYKNPGVMATVGKRKAVVDLPKTHFKGFFAWLIWMFLHLMLILNIKNRLIIFVNWAFSYITNDTTLRLILLPTKKEVELAASHHMLELSAKET